MKHSTHKKIKQLAAGALLTIMACSTAFAGTWQSDIFGWHYMQDDGSYAANGWLNDNGTYYWMDGSGNMQTGWIQDVDGNFYYMNTALTGVEGAMHTGWVKDNGFWYFLDTRAGATQGSRLTGWQWIDGYCYYFDPLLGGAMAASTITPDGCLVDANGRWASPDGTLYYEAGKGISTIVANTNTATGTGIISISGSGSSGGSGGGGGSSSRSSDASRFSGDNSVSYSANDFTNGNYSKMTSSERKAVDKVIEEFKDEYITSDMSDFEKEITIIQWICENCEYKVGSGWSNATAYSSLVNGVAQCSGYADGFLQMGKACGLTVRYVYNSTHAWNLIKLDGDWYHVDVTWEDYDGCGFNYLRNEYINLEDAEIRTISSHYTWNPSSTKCNGIAYGPKTVAEYLNSGVIDTSLGTSYKAQEQEFFDSFNDEYGHVMTYSSTDSAVNEIVSFLSGQIDASMSGKVLMYMPSKYKTSTSGDYTKVRNILNDIQTRVCEQINAAYGDQLNEVSMYFFLEGDSDGHYYAYTYFTYSHKKVIVSVDYTIHYVDNNTGEEVAVQSGTADTETYVELNIPDGYKVLSSSKLSCTVRSGDFSYNGTRIKINGSGTIDFDVPVKTTTQSTSSISTLSVTADEAEEGLEEEVEDIIIEEKVEADDRTEEKDAVVEKAEEKTEEKSEELTENKAEEKAGEKTEETVEEKVEMKATETIEEKVDTRQEGSEDMVDKLSSKAEIEEEEDENIELLPAKEDSTEDDAVEEDSEE